MGVSRSANTVNTRFEKFIQHIIFIGCHHQLIDRQTHHAGNMPCTHIAKITTWHTEADFLRIVFGGLKITRKVINNLGQQTRPIDGVHRSNFVFALEV